jgi:hypothetical protein
VDGVGALAQLVGCIISTAECLNTSTTRGVTTAGMVVRVSIRSCVDGAEAIKRLIRSGSDMSTVSRPCNVVEAWQVSWTTSEAACEACQGLAGAKAWLFRLSLAKSS